MKLFAGEMLVKPGESGSWMSVEGVDFGTQGASSVSVTSRSKAGIGICVYAGSDKVAEFKTSASDGFVDETFDLTSKVTGKTDIRFVFDGSEGDIRSWKFN